MKIRIISTRKVVAAFAATFLLATTGGCSPTEIRDVTAAPPTCEPGPIVFAIPDVSASTDGQTGANGPYEQDMMKALEWTARACGDVFSAPADGNSIAKSWVIDGTQFRQAIGGNEAFGAEARAAKAKSLLPAVRRLLRMRSESGSDVLGGLARIRRLMDTLPKDRQVKVALLTDGAIFIKSAAPVSMYDIPLDTAARREKFVSGLVKAGEVPDFGGRAEIYLAGVGVGVSNRNKARDILATWELLVPAMNAELKSNDSRLRLS